MKWGDRLNQSVGEHQGNVFVLCLAETLLCQPPTRLADDAVAFTVPVGELVAYLDECLATVIHPEVYRPR
jgi:hypothetical protein